MSNEEGAIGVIDEIVCDEVRDESAVHVSHAEHAREDAHRTPRNWADPRSVFPARRGKKKSRSSSAP
ncbi:MAG: hypothetical protein IPJ65_43655 [Archangiaceae bacterium]|nr:hypothetical protein [Archangiaceae bacterium]